MQSPPGGVKVHQRPKTPKMAPLQAAGGRGSGQKFFFHKTRKLRHKKLSNIWFFGINKGPFRKKLLAKNLKMQNMGSPRDTNFEFFSPALFAGNRQKRFQIWVRIGQNFWSRGVPGVPGPIGPYEVPYSPPIFCRIFAKDGLQKPAYHLIDAQC